MWWENGTLMVWVILSWLGMRALWSKPYLWLSCQKRASVERELLLLCWLWTPWCMAPLICVYLVFFVNLPSLKRTKKSSEVESGLRPSACQFCTVVKREGRNCPIVCLWARTLFPKNLKTCSPFQGWCVTEGVNATLVCVLSLGFVFYKPCW